MATNSRFLTRLEKAAGFGMTAHVVLLMGGAIARKKGRSWLRPSEITKYANFLR